VNRDRDKRPTPFSPADWHPFTIPLDEEKSSGIVDPLDDPVIQEMERQSSGRQKE